MTGYRLYTQILIGNTRYVIKLGIRIVQTYNATVFGNSQ